MTISTTGLKDQYWGDGVTATFPVTQQFQNASELLVTVLAVDGVTESTKTLVTHYNVSGGSGATGSITFTAGNIPTGSGAPGSQKITITRNMPLTQATDLTPNDPFPADTVERTFGDRLIMIIQQQQERINRAVKLQVSTALASAPELVDPTPNTALVMDPTGAKIIAGPTLTAISSAAANAIAAAASAAAALVSQIAAAASAAAALVSQNAAAASASSASTSAGTATTQAGIATTQASNASTSASTATTQASNASTSASTATTQAGIATTQAGIATTQAGTATTQAGTATTQAGIATAAAAAAAASAGVVNQRFCGTATGTANALTLTPGVALSSYTNALLEFIIASANTTEAVVANVSTLGNKSLKVNLNGTKRDPAIGMLQAGMNIIAQYDGTDLMILNAPWDTQGTDVASAATVALASTTGNFINLTGTGGPVTAISGLAKGRRVLMRHTGIQTLTHSATLFLLNNAANITTAVGDFSEWISDGTNVYMTQYMRANGAALTGTSATNSVQDFRLSLTSGLPVTTADVTAATTIYAVPRGGNRIALYDGANWNIRTSAQFSLALGTLTNALPYDVFCYDNAGVPTLEFLAWTNATTRATALAYQDGILVKSGATTRRYLGSFYTTSTTTTEDSKANRYLWNFCQRTSRYLHVPFTSSPTTTSASFVELSSSFRANFLIGVAEDPLHVDVAATGQIDTIGLSFFLSIGIDGTTASDIGVLPASPRANDPGCISFSGNIIVAAGRHYATLLGHSNGSATATYLGGATSGARTVLGGSILG